MKVPESSLQSKKTPKWTALVMSRGNFFFKKADIEPLSLHVLSLRNKEIYGETGEHRQALCVCFTCDSCSLLNFNLGICCLIIEKWGAVGQEVLGNIHLRSAGG